MWERVILKEASPNEGLGLTQQMVDHMKPLFGLNSMDTRRVRLNACLRRVNAAHKGWSMRDGSANWEAVPTASSGGTVFLVFRDHANGARAVMLSELEGTMRKGKLRPGGGTLYYSANLCMDLLLVSAFRLMFDAKPFDLASMLVLPQGCVLPISEMDALSRRSPFTGALAGPSGPQLKAILHPFVPMALQRVEAWWENVSLGQVWDVLAFHGFAPSHLRRLVKNMRGLSAKFQQMLTLEPRIPGLSGGSGVPPSMLRMLPAGFSLGLSTEGTPPASAGGLRAAGADTPRDQSKGEVGGESVGSPTVGTPKRFSSPQAGDGTGTKPGTAASARSGLQRGGARSESMSRTASGDYGGGGENGRGKTGSRGLSRISRPGSGSDMQSMARGDEDDERARGEDEIFGWEANPGPMSEPMKTGPGAGVEEMRRGAGAGNARDGAWAKRSGGDAE